MSKNYRTTKTFALQVSTHDNSWGGPKLPTSRLKRAFQIFLVLVGTICILIPSFKLGRSIVRAPDFKLPDTVKQGTVFTVPASEEITSVQLEGHALPELKLKQPMFLVAASVGPELSLVLNYKAPEKKLSLKSLVPHFENPQYDVFNKQIHVEPAPADAGEPDITGVERSAPATPAVAASTFTRTDGLISASCWKKPALEELPAPPARAGRKPPPRQAALTSAGQGEVLQVSTPEKGEKTIVIYHGGGVYSRYYGIRDSKVRKGDRVTPGLQIATTELGNWKKPPTARWDLFMNQNELNRPSFLALSSQLCDLK